jgi:pimeloyl-ACP methyl ester carboxylesterase
MDHEIIRTATYGGLAADELPGSSERPPVILLHGLTFVRTMWRPALERLAELDPGRRAIAVDVPGHGHSPDAPSYALDALVARIQDVVRDAAIDAPVLVGHSASTATAALYAATHPTSGVVEVEGGFVVAPFARMLQSVAPVLHGPGFAEVWARIAAGAFRLAEVPEPVRQFVEKTSRPRQEVVLGYWQDLLERTPDDVERWIDEGTDRLRAMELPMMSVVGQEPSPEEAAWLALHLPILRTVVWRGSGHFPHLAHPGRFAELLAATGEWSPRAVAAGAG